MNTLEIPTSSPANLPDDVEALKTLLRAKDSEISTLQRLQEEAEGKLRDTQATWELKFAVSVFYYDDIVCSILVI